MAKNNPESRIFGSIFGQKISFNIAESLVKLPCHNDVVHYAHCMIFKLSTDRNFYPLLNRIFNKVRVNLFEGASSHCLMLALVALAQSCSCSDDVISQIPPPPEVIESAVQGKVCAPNSDEGLGGARVFVEIVEGTQVEVIETLTENDGSFVLGPLEAGTYTLRIERGSFSTTVDDVVVASSGVDLGEVNSCEWDPDLNMRVYDGHDSIEDVLIQLGFDANEFEVVQTNHGEAYRDATQQSWLASEFADYEAFKDYDILFINCGAHEWAITGDHIGFSELLQVRDNLRKFVDEGGSIYFSDWSYDLMETMFPTAASWYGDDETFNAAEVANSQMLSGRVVDESTSLLIGSNSLSLELHDSRVALAKSLGENTRVLVEADIEIEGEVLSGVDSFVDDGRGSCQGRCGDDYNPSDSCQCNDRCSQFGNCCSDYMALCEDDDFGYGECSGACGSVVPGASCQCNAYCLDRGNCCDDFEGACQVVDQRATKTAVPLVFEYRPNGTQGGRVIFTSLHNDSENGEDATELLRAIIFSL